MRPLALYRRRRTPRNITRHLYALRPALPACCAGFADAAGAPTTCHQQVAASDVPAARAFRHDARQARGLGGNRDQTCAQFSCTRFCARHAVLVLTPGVLPAGLRSQYWRGLPMPRHTCFFYHRATTAVQLLSWPRLLFHAPLRPCAHHTFVVVRTFFHRHAP